MPGQPGNYKIGGYMVAAMFTMLDSTTGILFVPLSVIMAAGHDGWIAPLLTIPAGFYVVLVSVWLGSLYPGKTLIEYLPLILGKIAGKIIAWAYVLFLLYLFSTVVRECLALLYGTGIFRQTPYQVVALLLIITTTYTTVCGVEVISRSIWYFWLFMVASYILFLLGTIPFIKFDSLFPIGEAGFKTIMQSSLTPHAYRGELILLAFLFPYIKTRKEALWGGIAANLIIAGFITFTTIAAIGILGMKIASHSYYSAFFLADYIPAAGLKIVLVTIWIAAFWGKITMGQFFISNGIAQATGLKDHRPLAWTIGILLLVFSQVFYQNTTDMFQSVPRTFPGVALFFEYLIPGVLLLIAWFKAKSGKKDSSVAPNS